MRDTIHIKFLSKPEIDLGPDILKCDEQPVELNPGIDGVRYLWSTGNSNQVLSVTESGKYWLNIENECGVAADTIQVKLSGPNLDSIPNIITPNEDTKNDSFVIDEPIKGCTFEVFNRWGKKVFFSSSYQNDWSADNLESGTYYFVLHEKKCGTRFKGSIHVRR